MAPSHLREVNGWIGYLTMDCLVCSRYTWILKHHLLHHPDTWRTDPTPIDRQRLFGPNILVETINIIYTVLGYWYLDLQDLVTKFDLWKLLSLVVRFGYLLSLPLNALVATIITLSICANYLALLTHTVPCNKSTNDKDIHQCRTSIDIFPQSKLFNFISGGLNCHLVHHMVPSLPRSLHPSASIKINEMIPTEYRYVETWSELKAVWIMRHKIFPEVIMIKDLPRYLKKNGGTAARQLAQDLTSLIVLVYISTSLSSFKLL